MRLVPLLFTASLLLTAGDKGVQRRPSESDYSAHQDAAGAILAASIVPAKQIEKTFSTDIARHDIVLEVAVYPRNGTTFDIDWLDFRLKIGDAVAYVERPRAVAAPWPDAGPAPDKPVTVLTEAGVVYGRTSDPVNGHRSELGTYEGVAVTNDPRAAAPPSPRQYPDPQILEHRVAQMMLPEGPAGTAVAGYLFFPADKVKRHKGLIVDLQWSGNHSSATLRLVQK